MGADDEAGAAVDEMAEALLLAGRLGMEIEDDRVGLLLQRARVEDDLRRFEGVVEFRMHEDPAHDVGNEHTRAVPGIEKAGAAAGRALGIVGGTQELIVAAGKSDSLLLVPDVIACRHHIGAGIDRFQKDILGDAEAAGGVLAVDDDEIELEVGNQAGEAVPYRRASRLADHVTQKKQPHSLSNPRGKKAKAAFCQDGIQAYVVRLVGHMCHFLAVECNADQLWMQAFLP